MVMRILDTEVTMGVLNRVLIATLLGLLLFAMPCWGGETKEGKRHLKRGQKFEKRGRFKEALEQYSRAIQLDGELKRAWFRRGVLYFRSSHFEEARSDLTRAIELKPDHGLALYVRGVANRYLMELEQAKSDLTEAIELYPNNLLIFVERAHVHTLRNEFLKAISDLDRAEEMLWNTASRIQAARTMVREVEQIDRTSGRSIGAISRPQYGFPLSSPESLFLESTIRDQVESWVNVFGHDLREHFFVVYFSRGMTRWVVSDHEGAFEDFGKLLLADHSALGRGVLHYLKGDFALAQESLLASLSGSNWYMRNYAEIWIWLSSVNLGQFEEANARIRSHFFRKSSKGEFRYTQRIAQFLLGEIELSELVDFADADDPVTKRGRLCEAAFYSAQIALLMKGKDGWAKLLIDRCLETGAWNFYEYKAAAIQKVVLSERLGKKVEAD